MPWAWLRGRRVQKGGAGAPKLIVGLGNPGARYAHTRHNVGFMVVDAVAEQHGLQLTKRGFHSFWGDGRLDGHKVVLLKPQTFMNLSGQAVAAALRYYRAPAADLLVVYDDLDLPTGRLRLRAAGGAGGHKGMRSVIEHLGHETFARVRIGIDRPPPGWAVPDWVLAPFTADEQPLVRQAVDAAAAAVALFVAEGIEAAMNRFNKTGDRPNP